MSEPLDVARRIAAVKRHPVTRWRATIGLAIRMAFHARQGGASEPFAVLGDTTRLRARLDVDERDIGRLVVGAKTIVRASAFPGQDYPGTVVEIGRRMGRKNVRTDDPVERNDTKILEVVVALDGTPPLVVGQRVTGYVLRTK